MADRKNGAGGLRQKLHFQKRGEAEDEFGNPLPGGDFETVFTDYAELVPRMGGETVMASRLQGIQPYTMRVRSNGNTRQVTTAWQIVDARNANRIFNIKGISDSDQKNQYLELLVVEGEAS
jgi:head-tail adaptor